MPINETLLKIENEVYELVGKIDYGEISDIEAYWASLISSIEKLSEFGYQMDEGMVSISSALTPFADLIDDDLREIAVEMEQICEGGGSSDAIGEDDIDTLQDLAIDFEKKFLKFTDKLRAKHE